MYKTRNFIQGIGGITRSMIRKYSKLITYPKMADEVTPFSLNHYDVIGFDLDHTICKYNLSSFLPMIYDSVAQFLVDKHQYPTCLKQNKLPLNFCQRGLVLDKERGNILKLDENRVILQAYHGSKQMSKVDISNVYGPSNIWEDCVNIPKSLCAQDFSNKPFYVFRDFFTSVGALICANIVDLIDIQNNGQLTKYSFFKDYFDTIKHIYNPWNFNTLTNYYYPSLRQYPHLYVEKNSQPVKDWLKNLRKHKKVFLLTGSKADIAHFLAEQCIGEDWRDYFDGLFTYACKPRFFTEKNSFYLVKDFKDAQTVSASELQSSTMYSRGNVGDLNEFCSVLSGVKNPKILYVGDSIVEDVYAASEFGNWDTIAIVEELDAEHKKDSNHILYSNQWGSFFTKGNNQTFWAKVIADHSKLAVANLLSLSTLGIEDKVLPFSPTTPRAGFYTAGLP